MKINTLFAVAIPCALLVACGGEPAPSAGPLPPAPIAPPAADPAAQATLEGASGRMVEGEIDLSTTTGGVLLDGAVLGLAPNTTHGIHVHEQGDCSAPDASSAGGHFSPDDNMHGNPVSGEHHLGDMPNIVADATGRARVSTTIVGATLGDDGPRDLMGRAIVVHMEPDDYKTQPAGNSGERIACAVIAAP